MPLKRDVTMAWFLAVWPVVTGLTMIAFADRFTSASWRFAAGMPGGYGTWATVLIVCGGALIATRHHPGHSGHIVSLTLVGLWWVLLGLVFAWTALQDPLANPFGAPVWTGVGVIYWLWAFFEVRAAKR